MPLLSIPSRLAWFAKPSIDRSMDGWKQLERRRDEQGKTEPVGFEHSWDAPHRLTNMVLFKLQRHGDHHVNSTRRYQTLRAEPSRSPQVTFDFS